MDIIPGIEIIDATSEFLKRGFTKTLEINNEFVQPKNDEEIAKLVKFGKEAGAVTEVDWDNTPEEAIVIRFPKFYFPQVVLVKNLQEKMRDYFKYLK
jgi:hypothetical protein